ncbi:MAG: glycerol-phosphatase [Actinomycetota bacterium]|nr:glycerol-phosphatase [Actinomycetota bacterium]
MPELVTPGRNTEPEVTLAGRHDVLLMDLDGVVYAGPSAVPHAVEVLVACRSDGVRLAFVTNNASRTPGQVAEHLQALGLPADVADVVTSAQAGAGMLAKILPTGSRVLVAGGEGLVEAVTERGFVVTRTAADSPAAVIQGFDPDIGWRQLAEATYAVRAGAHYIATNADLTIPTAAGIAPGNGLLVAAVAQAAGVRPQVAGKPERPLMMESIERTAGLAPLVVGDRLDTDIRGAGNAGLPSLLVFTGVSGIPELLSADGRDRPSHLGADLRALREPPVMTEVTTTADGGVESTRCRHAGFQLLDGEAVENLSVSAGAGRWIDRVRALAALVWEARDQGRACGFESALRGIEADRSKDPD